MASDSEPVRCSCGEMLLDGMDDSHVKVGEDEFRFRRTTDFVGCPRCGTLYSVADLAPGINHASDGPTHEIADPLEELRQLAAQIDTLDPLTFDIDADEVIDDPDRV